MNRPHNGMDVIDGRDIIAAIAELEQARDAAKGMAEEARQQMTSLDDEFAAIEDDTDAADELISMFDDLTRSLWIDGDGNEYRHSSEWDEDTLDELRQLRSLVDDIGDTLIRDRGLIADSYLETYMQDFAEGCGLIEDANAWPCTHINWEMAVDDAKQDYKQVDFGGVTYWWRS